MRKILGIIALYLLFAACKDDDERTLINFTDSSAELADSGIDLGCDATTEVLKFTCPPNLTPVATVESVAGEPDWLKAELQLTEPGVGEVTITAEGNTGNERSATVVVSAGKESVGIEVRQVAYDGITVDRTVFNIGRDGGKITVRCRSNEELKKPNIYFYDHENHYYQWAVRTDFRSLGDGDYEIEIAVEKNDGFGRLASMLLENGSKSARVTLIQSPKLFGDTETVKMPDEGGILNLKLGYTGNPDGEDMRNIRRIKHLAINGGINDYDLDIIRLYTADATHPVMLDFSLTKLNSEVKNPCAYEGYVPLQKECDVTIAVDNCIPDRMFDGAKGLAGCMMSDRFLSIGARAFASTPMTQIDIPGTIISIGDYAFNGCRNLTSINIEKFGLLEALGASPFSTGCRIESIFLSWHLNRVADETFHDFNVANLYVDKYEPPTWKFDSTTKIDTLYLPYDPSKDLIGAYRAAPCWGEITEIREWSYEWEEAPW